MKRVFVLMVICAGFMASPALAQTSCIPKELRTSLETSKKAGSEKLQDAKEEYAKAKELADRPIGSREKERAQVASQAAFKKFKDAEIKSSAQNEMAGPLLALAPCPPHADTASTATAQTQAPYAAEFADLRGTLKWNQRLLIILSFLFIAAIILLYISLRRVAKRIDSSLYDCAIRLKDAAETQTDRIQNFLSRIQARSTAETHGAPLSPKSGGKIPKTQFSPQAAESVEPTAGKAAHEYASTDSLTGSSTRMLQQAHDPPGHAPTSPSQRSHSNVNTHYGVASKISPPLLLGEEDFDGQLAESEIWPIVLPVAGSLVETLPNLDTASLTRELMSEIERSRPGVAKRMRSIGFQAISGRLAQDGRETSRNPEMFAVELPSRILLFPSPRGKYKQAFDTYFEGANNENWKECIQPALVQKTGDNLLSVIERGISGR